MQDPVLVVSVFGRGLGLAARLIEQEVPVQLLDITEDLGKTSPEDEEGPFGFFQAGMNPTSIERLHQDDPPRNLEQGLTFVLSSGPLELKSPLTKNRLEKFGIQSEDFESLREFSGSRLNKKNIHRVSFEKTWLNQFAANWSSNSSDFVPCASLSGFSLPLATDFWMRAVSRPGLLKSSEWGRRRGITINQDLQILDLAKLNSKTLKAVEVRKRNSQTTEVMSFEQVVWCLTSAETEFLGTKLEEKLFPYGILQPKWVWTRFRFRVLPGSQREVLPAHSVWIDDLDLPWTHDNLFVLQQSPSADLFDAWVRIPSDQRLQRSYLLEQQDKIQKHLQRKFFALDIQKAEDPAASEKTYREMGPPRFPLFDSRELLAFKNSNENNLNFHSPEVWSGLGWNALVDFEERLFQKLNQWWIVREELRKKRELKNRKE